VAILAETARSKTKNPPASLPAGCSSLLPSVKRRKPTLNGGPLHFWGFSKFVKTARVVNPLGYWFPLPKTPISKGTEKPPGPPSGSLCGFKTILSGSSDNREKSKAAQIHLRRLTPTPQPLRSLLICRAEMRRR